MSFVDDLFETIGEGVDKAGEVFGVVKDVYEETAPVPTVHKGLPQGAPPREEEPHRLERSQMDPGEQSIWLVPLVVLVAVVALMRLSKG